MSSFSFIISCFINLLFYFSIIFLKYCTVNKCKASINPNEDTNSNCGTKEFNETDYRGVIASTSLIDEVEGLLKEYECEPWTEEMKNEYPNAGLESNYCRNPDDYHGVYCYVKLPGQLGEPDKEVSLTKIESETTDEIFASFFSLYYMMIC